MKNLIGIITYNRKVSLDRCLSSLNQVLGEDRDKYTIFISDDASTDNTQDWLKEVADAKGWFDEAEFSKTRGGVAKNSNRVIKKAKELGSPITFLCNDDIIFLKNIFPLYEDAIALTSYDHFCYNDKESPNKSFNTFTGESPYKYDQVKEFAIRLVERMVGDGVFMTITQNMIEGLGGFDTKYGLYGAEHVDYTRRAAEAGFCRNVLDVQAAEGGIKVVQYYQKIPYALPDRSSHLKHALAVYYKQMQEEPQIFKDIIT